MKIHLHCEEFDGALHAQCGAIDVLPPSSRIVSEDDFEQTPRNQRCRKCAEYCWPYGGETE